MQRIAHGNLPACPPRGASRELPHSFSPLRSRPVRPLLALFCASLALTGCGPDDDEQAPAACRQGADEVLAALESAPGEVRLDGTPISDCLVKGSSPADVQEIGATLLAAAQALSDEVRSDPPGGAALRLGYLIGAVKRGAAGTQGIHHELVRRLELEAVQTERRGGAFLRGEQAGREGG